MRLVLFTICYLCSVWCEDGILTADPELPSQLDTDFAHNLVEDDMKTASPLPQSTNVVLASNITLVNSTDPLNSTQKLVQCIPYVGDAEVQLINDTELLKVLTPHANITSRDVPASCLLVLFYSKHCPFSSLAAPHFNALPRAFPTLKMVALDAMTYHTFNAHNGIVGVPTLLLFHNGRLVAKFNDSEYTLELFSKFVAKYTGIEPADKSIVTSADFGGPVISIPNKDFDSFLIISWLFVIACSVYYFSKSRFWKWIVETIQSNWRESEVHIQHDSEHEHAD